MNVITLVAIFFAFSFAAFSQPLLVSTNLFVVDIDNDGNQDFRFFARVDSEGSPLFVGTQVTALNQSECLRATSSTTFVEVGLEIGLALNPYVSTDGSNRVPISAYLARWSGETGVWTFYDAGWKEGAGARLEVILGFRLNVDGVIHHGWIRFTRPDARPETLFTVGGHDWNPVPNAPIRAGWPPEIPITTEALPGGSGLRLSWPSAISSWILEGTPSLSAPVVWEVYPSGGSYADVPPVDGDRYFRLRRPE